jgi:hypothetical protein
MKEPSGILRDIAQMREMDARGEAFGDRGDVVVRAGAERARAQGQPVGDAVDGAEHEGDVVAAGDDARQAHQRARRVVGMDREAHAELFGGRDDLAQEAREVFAQDRRRHAAIAVQHARRPGMS